MPTDKPEWLPDWRRASGYPDPRGSPRTPPYGWAWEFLRRNPDYQRAAKRLHELISELGDEFRELAIQRGTGALRRAKQPPHLRDKEERKSNLVKSMQREYGLRGWVVPPLPEEMEPGDIFEISDVSRLADQEDLEGNLMWFPFRLNHPVEPQLQRARLLIDRNRSNRRQGQRPREANFRTYLRLLDAETDGATVKKMAAVIYPRVSDERPRYLASDRVRKALNKARRIRDEDFRVIPLALQIKSKIARSGK